MINIVEYSRPDDYYETLAARYRRAQGAPTSTRAALAAASRADDLVYVVVGDAAVVKPQLDKLGLPIEVRAAQ